MQMLKPLIKSFIYRLGGYRPPSEPSIFQQSFPIFVKSFGGLNPDKFFYVIRQPGSGRGLFSLFSSVLCHLDICDSLELIPVIDFENFPCVYNDPEVTQTKNSWEYYFEPVSDYTLSEVYGSKKVFFSTPSYPQHYSYSITHESHLYEIFKKYIKVKPFVEEAVQSFYSKNFVNKKVLGVHFRGQELKTAPGHWYPPSKTQMKGAIDLLLSKHNFNTIFVVTEDASYIDFLTSSYKNLNVIFNQHYRTYGSNAYKEYPRSTHLYKLRLEVLVDALLLSRCQGLIYCTSNVATVADFINQSRYEAKIQINNGPNFSNPILARYSWFIKGVLPTNLGGFSNQFTIHN